MSLSSSPVSPSSSQNQVRSEGGNIRADVNYSNCPIPEAYSLILHPSEEDMQIMSTSDSNNGTNIGTESKKCDRSSLGLSNTPSTSEVFHSNIASTNRNAPNLPASNRPSSSSTFVSRDVREKGKHKAAPIKPREQLDIQPPGSHVAPDLSLLGPQCLNLNSRIDFVKNSFEICIPRSLINDGMYYFSADCQADRGRFQLTKSEQHPVEGVDEIWYDLNLSYNRRTDNL